METIKSGIYFIKNTLNNKIYIGSSINLSRRKNLHFSQLNNNIHINNYLQNSFNQNSTNLEFEIVEHCESKDLLIREQYYLDLYYDNQKKCYNINKIAGSMLGFKHSDESRKKMSLAKIGKKRPFSEEHKIRLRKPKPQSFKQKISGSNNPNYKNRGELNKSSKSVAQINKKTNKIIETFGSTREANRKTGIAFQSIGQCCLGRLKSSGGFIWKYV